jgi:hypothetical protein
MKKLLKRCCREFQILTRTHECHLMRKSTAHTTTSGAVYQNARLLPKVPPQVPHDLENEVYNRFSVFLNERMRNGSNSVHRLRESRINHSHWYLKPSNRLTDDRQVHSI